MKPPPLPNAVKEYVAAAPVCRIATVRAGGEPHVIPVCPVFDGDATVYVDLDPKSATAAALRHEHLCWSSARTAPEPWRGFSTVPVSRGVQSTQVINQAR